MDRGARAMPFIASDMLALRLHTCVHNAGFLFTDAPPHAITSCTYSTVRRDGNTRSISDVTALYLFS